MRTHLPGNYCLYCVCFLLLSSCYSNKRLVYLQTDKSWKTKTTVIENDPALYRLQASDILSIQIKNSVETEAADIFNVGSLHNSMMASPGAFYMEGHSVDHHGYITLPVLGKLLVTGLTLGEVQQLIQTHAEKYLNDPTVIVKLTSFKITILGEVKAPGLYFVYNNQATVLEALGMAGDLTTFGNRKNVKLIRQVPTGSRVTLLDLTDPILLQSEYFFMSPGDVLYVEPLKARTKRSNLEILSVVFSAITTAVLIMSYVNSTN